MKDFILTVPNAATSEYCEYLIRRFDFFQETRAEGRGPIWSRQAQEQGISKLLKEDNTYFLGGDGEDHLPQQKGDDVLYSTDTRLLEQLVSIIWGTYDVYAKEYAIIPTLNKHFISPTVRIQKTKPGQGYHTWHCDSDDMFSSRRIIVVNLYLNTVEKGGETEFLYQQKRVSAEQGTMVLFPSAWTHVHRGNPPLSGDKYIVTTWLEFGHSE